MPTTDQVWPRMHSVYGWAVVFTMLTIALGSMVCATDSSSACPGWPACYDNQLGSIGPTLKTGWLHNPIIEFVHRVISGLCLVFLAWSAWLGRRSTDRRVRWYPLIGVLLALSSAVFGMMIILFTLPTPLAMIDVGGAVIALGLITVARYALGAPNGAAAGAGGEAGAASAPRYATTGDTGSVTPTALGTDHTSLVHKLATTAFVLTVTMHLIAISLAGTTPDGYRSFTRCLSWPIWQIVDIDGSIGWQWVRLVLGVAAAALIVAAAVLALRQPALRAPAAILLAVFAVEMAVSVLIRTTGLAPTQTSGIDANVAVFYAFMASVVLWAVANLAGAALRAATPRPRRLDVPLTTHEVV